ncbi:MAG: DUF4926 domain-containing protein [Pyrinomonadaceae bacterium]
MDTIQLLDVIALAEDMPGESLKRGAVGTVVEKWAEGVYEVEFGDDTGRAYAFAAVRTGQMMKLYFRKHEAA